MNTPLIKWTGSKRQIASLIISHFPKQIECYYEPFLGGGSVFLSLLKSNISVKRFYLSDKNDDLIKIFKIVQKNPYELIFSYYEKWNLLQKDSDYFYIEREHYNKTKDPLSFYFLTRTCYNGTIRYNKKGEFNTSHHFGRTGMEPSRVEKIINYYSSLMYKKDIQFVNSSFELINPTNNLDVIYLDPPYTNTPNLYFGNISLNLLLDFIKNLKCSWFMNLNCVNKTDNEEVIDLQYTNKKMLNSGCSSFSRIKKKIVDVNEYFYYKLV